MEITGIDALVFGVTNRKTSQQFLSEWGLRQTNEDANSLTFQTLDGGQIIVRDHDDPSLPPAFEEGSTLRQAIWGVKNAKALQQLADSLTSHSNFSATDDTLSIADADGLSLAFRSTNRRPVATTSATMNTSSQPNARIDERAPVYSHAEPNSIGHYVLFSPDVVKSVAFYTETLGFKVTDYYPDAGYFLRCREEGGHHNVFLLQTPDHKRGLNHVAFTVNDIHEVFGGGLHVSRQGWTTQIGPGRHPISSAYFWYVESPLGGLFEYYADEDWCTSKWQSKSWERTPEHYAEWAIAGGIDGHTRRQSKA